MAGGVETPKSQRCPPSRGLAPVNRRGVPTPIGTLSYRANLRWRGHSRALLHTRYCDVSGSIERGSSPSGPIGNTANDRHGIWRDLYHSPTGAKVNTKPRVSGEAIGTHLAYIFAHGSVRSEMLLVRPHRREQHLIAVSSRATLHGIQQRKLPLPLASGTRVISNALRAADARPIIRSSCARRITWSQPPSGNSSRPSSLAIRTAEYAPAHLTSVGANRLETSVQDPWTSWGSSYAAG